MFNASVILWHYVAFRRAKGASVKEQPVETTLYSLSDAPPEPKERRAGERHLSLFRVGSITIGDRRELCLIKNISAGGMMIRAYCAIPKGTELSIELKGGQPVVGRASWLKGDNVGVTFEAPIDVIEILSGSADGQKQRMPRIEVDSVATVRDGANIWRLPVCDISQGGVKLRGEPPIDYGSDVVISLPGLEAQRGALRWRHDGNIGLSFNRLVPLATLVSWLQGIRDGLRAAS
jgi:hypothetical protein